jgi:hypothetical protein
MALLAHRQAADGDHYDLLFCDPEGGEGLLTWRLAEPTWRWSEVGVIEAVALARHRERYLRYEGPLSEGRGVVERVDFGQIWPVDWGPSGGTIRFETERFAGHVRLDLTKGQIWGLVVVAQGE